MYTHQPGAMDVIAWLLAEAGANPDATDHSGRKPGEADLAKEAPALEPSERASEIMKMLQDARGRKAPITAVASPFPSSLSQ